MKKILLAIVALLSFTVCFSQIKVPVQTDTLVIQSMQYHFDEIRPENWPFSYVVRTPSSFIFGDQEFKIDHSYNHGSYKEFRLEYGGFSTKALEQRESENTISLDFDGYLLICYKPGYTPEPKIDSKVISTCASKPNASLAGRSVDMAGLKRPAYNSQASGVVVVSIWVDQYGQVTKAVAGAAGTTTTDKTLWAASRKAAMETHFNMDGDAPALQEGTITYIFNLQ